MKGLRKRLTYANVMSSIAVFLVLGGGAAMAASKIGTEEIKDNAVTTAKISPEAVTQGKIKVGAVGESRLGEDSVTSPKLATGAVTAGKLGQSSVTAGTIAAGAVTGSKIGPTEVSASDYIEVAPGEAKISEFSCPAGQTLLSGGFVNNLLNPGLVLLGDEPGGPNAWSVAARNTTSGTLIYRIFVLCLK